MASAAPLMQKATARVALINLDEFTSATFLRARELRDTTSSSNGKTQTICCIGAGKIPGKQRSRRPVRS